MRRQALTMDCKRPPQARRPMVPLAVAATVVQALPPRPPARPAVPIGSVAVALAVVAAAFVVNSPLMGQWGVEHRWAWGILGFWGEVGGILALLGMLFRQPAIAWIGASVFLVAALVLSGIVWAGHPLALALLAAVAAWQMRRQARADQEMRAQGWLRA